MTRPDYLSGTYREGKFRPYQLLGEYKSRLDPTSAKEAMESARSGETLHGTFKDGNFRPAESSSRQGYGHTISDSSGRAYSADYSGRLYDEQRRVVGQISEDGKLIPIRQASPPRGQSQNYQKQVIPLEIGKRTYPIEAVEDPGLVNMARYLLRHNEVFASRSRDPRRGMPSDLKIEVFEAELPPFTRTEYGPFNAGVTKNHKVGENYQILIDKRLSPAEKLAVLAHELGHLSGGYKTSDKEAHLLGLKLMADMYTFYNEVKKADTNNRLSTEEFSRKYIGEALQTLIISGKAHFGVTQQDLSRIEGIALDQSNYPRNANLERRVFNLLAIPSLVLSLFLLSPNFTGNAIASLSTKTTSLIGAILLIIGVVSTYFWIDNKRN